MEGMSNQGFVPPSGIDKSKVLDVKPLRCLVPVFPSSNEAPPFVCSPPFGPYPPGFTPFYPFNLPQSSQNMHGTNPSQTSPGPTPLRSYRASQPSPIGVHFSGGVSNGDTGSDMDTARDGGTPVPRQRTKLGSTSVPRKKTKKSRATGFGAGGEFLMGVNAAERDDGNKETVDYVRIMFDAVRRRLSQMEDSKESVTGLIRRADLKAGNILMSKNFRTNMRKRIGTVPGVEIGDIFFFRMEMCIAGLHSQSMAGIDTMVFRSDVDEEPVAISIVSSGGYGDEAEDTDVLIYSGQGGIANNKEKTASDQKLVRGNLALDRSSRRVNEVRVIRGVKDTVHTLAKVYVYDGLYTIQEAWVEKGKSGCNVFKYKFVRQPGQPAAFAIWKSIQKWKEGFASRSGLILPDLTSGAESIPVSLVNDVDDEKGPAYFTYVSTLKNPKSFNLGQSSFGCNCHKECLPGDLNCSCIRKNGGDFPYTTHGVLVSRKSLIHECGPTCPCVPNCKNRVSQTGLKVRLEVFKTKDKGWGLRSLDPIRAGTFICEYAGEVIKQDGKEDENNNYFFDTTHLYDDSFKWNYEPALLDEERNADENEDYDIPYALRISSKNAGNVARFMNHSCYPNIFWQPVVYDIDNEAFLHIAFYAIKHIPPMTELTYDYGVSRSGNNDGQGIDMLNRKRKCLCESVKCRGYFG